MRFTLRCLRTLTAWMTALCLSVLCVMPALAGNVGDSLTVAIQSTKTELIRPLDPKQRDILSVYDMVYSSLFEIDDNYIPQPSVADSWEVNGKTWTIKLRDDVHFSDGTNLTANDVVATINYILQRANDENTTDRGYYVNLKYFVSSATAKGNYTVQIKAARRYWGVLYALTFPILKADQVGMDNPLGSGPYYIADFQAKNYIRLETNTHWWKTLPQVSTIMVMMHNTGKQVIESFEYARADTIFSRAMAASQYRSGTNSLAFSGRTNQLEVLAMNLTARPLDDPNIRRAIELIIDQDRIAETVYGNMVTRTNLPTIPGMWMYDDSLDSRFANNIDEARRLLDEAGWEDTDGDGVRDKMKDDGSGAWRLRLRLYYYEQPENDVRVEVANMMAEELAQAGIECVVSALKFTEMSEKLKAGSYDLALLSYAMDPCPDPGFLLMRANTGNYFRYNSKNMNELCEKLRTSTDQHAFEQTLHQIWRQYVQDLPFITLYYRNASIVTRKMYTTVRDVRELELLRGIESFPN